jgi:integrase
LAWAKLLGRDLRCLGSVRRRLRHRIRKNQAYVSDYFARSAEASKIVHAGSPSFRRFVVTLITRFVTATAAWEWDDVPARVLFTRADIPKINHPVPQFIPDHELAALMTAVELPDLCQRAALIVARWSGARRDEIRRLAVDCLDSGPDGHPLAPVLHPTLDTGPRRWSSPLSPGSANHRHRLTL